MSVKIVKTTFVFKFFLLQVKKFFSSNCCLRNNLKWRTLIQNFENTVNPD